jgi:hypothetical protein
MNGNIQYLHQKLHDASADHLVKAAARAGEVAKTLEQHSRERFAAEPRLAVIANDTAAKMLLARHHSRRYRWQQQRALRQVKNSPQGRTRQQRSPTRKSVTSSSTDNADSGDSDADGPAPPPQGTIAEGTA